MRGKVENSTFPFVQIHLSPRSVLSTLCFGNENGIQEVLKLSQEFLVNEAEKILTSPDFASWPIDEVILIVSWRMLDFKFPSAKGNCLLIQQC